MKSLSLVVLVAACSTLGAPVPEPDLSCEGQPDPHCSHPIDRILVPKLRAHGSTPRDANADEVCRRMAIDLLGRAPTVAERTQCRTQTFAQMADTFLASPEFARTQRRAWGELIKYESLIVWSPDIVDLDGLVGKLYRGETTYSEFVRQVVVHPAFYGLHPDDSWTANVFSTFLGRPARQDEIDAARPLLQVWAGRGYCGREVWWNRYKESLAGGANEATAITNGNSLCYDGQKVEYGVNLCRCTADFLNPGCFTEVFGDFVQIVPYCVRAEPRAPENSFRLAPRTATGTNDLCPDNVTHREECRDRDRGTVEYTFEPFVERPQLPATAHAELYKIGDALVARDDVWEAAADRELRKLLGWWQATFKHPESDIPEVRTLLADMLREGMTVREVIALIVTSQLYVQPVAAPAELDATMLPPWLAGPAKLLSGESWFASAAGAVGENGGSCDFRWGQASDYETQWVDPRLIESTPSSIEARVPPVPPHGYTINTIQRLGGCTGDARRAEISNVGLTFSQAAIARELCAVATRVTPTGWTGDLAAAATHLIERVWARDPAGAEVALMVVEMQACMSAGACATADVAARWLCRRLIDSAEFSTY